MAEGHHAYYVMELAEGQLGTLGFIASWPKASEEERNGPSGHFAILNVRSMARRAMRPQKS